MIIRPTAITCFLTRSDNYNNIIKFYLDRWTYFITV